jgi:hypothetical protein
MPHDLHGVQAREAVAVVVDDTLCDLAFDSLVSVRNAQVDGDDGDVFRDVLGSRPKGNSAGLSGTFESIAR